MIALYVLLGVIGALLLITLGYNMGIEFMREKILGELKRLEQHRFRDVAIQDLKRIIKGI